MQPPSSPSPGTVSVLKHMLQRWGGSRDGTALLGLWGVVGTGITLHAVRSRQERHRFEHAAQKLPRAPAVAGTDGSTGGAGAGGGAAAAAQGGGSGDTNVDKAQAQAQAAAAKAAKRASRSRIVRLLRLAFGLDKEAQADAAAQAAAVAAAGSVGSTSASSLAAPRYGRREPLGYAACLSTGLVLRLVVGMRCSRQIGTLGRLLGTRDWNALFDGQLAYMAWCIPAAALNAFVVFSMERLSLSLRANMLAALTPRYCAHALAAKDELGDPEQRLADDATLFAKESAGLYASLFKPVVEVIITSRALGQMMGYAQMAQFYGYFALTAGWVRFVGPSLKRLTTDEREADGAHRARHARLAEFAEEVAVLRGGPAEARALAVAFAELEAKARGAQVERLAADSLSAYVNRLLRHASTQLWPSPLLFTS